MMPRPGSGASRGADLAHEGGANEANTTNSAVIVDEGFTIFLRITRLGMGPRRGDIAGDAYGRLQP
jgi:hypothetical protein